MDRLKTDPILLMFQRKDYTKRKEIYIKKRKCWPEDTKSQCLTIESAPERRSRPPTPK